ncbi:hypothetical protein LguiA_035228 [Lonicera macranthoides]
MAEINRSNSPTTLDDLPEKLLLHILSFLPTQEAIQTTVISPKWRNLWSFLPCLSFDQKLFSPDETPSLTLQFFISFITRTLVHRSSHSDIHSLTLTLHFTADLRPYHSHINSYIRYAVAHNAKSLTIAFQSKYIRWFVSPENDAVYDFQFSLLKNSAVRILSLDRCNLTIVSTQSVALSTIYLHEVQLTDAMILELFSVCVNLESLSMYQCVGMKDIEIVSSKLKDLTLFTFECDEGSLKINAPNLGSLWIAFFGVGHYVIEASALFEANICFIHKVSNYRYWSKVMRLLGHVERLSFQNWGYKVVAAKELFCSGFSFYNLKYLELDTMYSRSDLLGMAAALEHSPNLETLMLTRNLKIDEEDFEATISKEFGKINFSIPSLRKLKMKCYWGVEDDLRFLRLVIKNEVVLETIVLFPIRLTDGVKLPSIVLVKQLQRFQVLHGSFPNVDILYI